MREQGKEKRRWRGEWKEKGRGLKDGKEGNWGKMNGGKMNEWRENEWNGGLPQHGGLDPLIRSDNILMMMMMMIVA